jgi:hypothetical protein
MQASLQSQDSVPIYRYAIRTSTAGSVTFAASFCNTLILTLDDGFRTATSGMEQWLTEDYKLTPSEVAEVLGTSAEYNVSDVANRNAGILLKINTDRLQSLTPGVK